MNDVGMEKKSKKSRKYIIIPLCIAIYFAIIAYMNRDEWLVNGNFWSYWGKIAIEVVILVVLSFVIKRRDKYRSEREKNIQNG